MTNFKHLLLLNYFNPPLRPLSAIKFMQSLLKASKSVLYIFFVSKNLPDVQYAVNDTHLVFWAGKYSKKSDLGFSDV